MGYMYSAFSVYLQVRLLYKYLKFRNIVVKISLYLKILVKIRFVIFVTIFTTRTLQNIYKNMFYNFTNIFTVRINLHTIQFKL